MNRVSCNLLSFDAISHRVPSAVRQYTSRYWLVGSQARGDAGENSDVDILIESKNIESGRLLNKFRRSLCPGDRVDTLATYHKSDSLVRCSSGKWHFVLAKPGQEKKFPERIKLGQ